MENNSKKLVNKYIDEVKDRLPEWLKEDKEELNSILDELEEHIWDKAEELSELNKATPKSVKLAINQMGTASSIAKEYKKRGTPYIYITKELWPLYKQIITMVFLIIAAINIISLVFNLLAGNFQDAFNISGYFLGFFASFSIITIIFVALSMEGYLPEDFKSKAQLEKEQEELKKAKEIGLPISETGKHLKTFIKPAEKLIGGVIGLIIGLIILIQPISGFFNLMDPSFRFFLLLIGILIIFDAFLTISRGIIGNKMFSVHQGIEVLTILLKISAIPLFVILLQNPEIFPIIYWEGSTFIEIGIPVDFYDSYRITLGILITLFTLSIVSNVYKIIKLQKYKI